MYPYLIVEAPAPLIVSLIVHVFSACAVAPPSILPLGSLTI